MAKQSVENGRNYQIFDCFTMKYYPQKIDVPFLDVNLHRIIARDHCTSAHKCSTCFSLGHSCNVENTCVFKKCPSCKVVSNVNTSDEFLQEVIASFAY